MPSLIIERGQEKGLSYDLTESGIVVGRDPALEVVISDPARSVVRERNSATRLWLADSMVMAAVVAPGACDRIL